MHRSKPDVISLLVLVTPHFNMAATVSFIDPFRAANYLEGRTQFQWKIASLQGGGCIASNGMTIETQPLAEVRQARHDFVILSSSWTPESFNTAPLHMSLWRWASEGATLGGLDTGALILAEAGLLKNHRATVHYEHIDAMQELYPNVDVSEELFVFDGNRISCCGGAASVDFALHIIKGTHGEALANAAARYVFHQTVRPQGTMQSPGLAEPMGQLAPGSVKRAIAMMEQNLETPLSIPEICEAIDLSQRQLNRLFARYVKKTPKVYYRDIRLDRARGLVTQTEMPLLEVAIASGFASHVHFSRAYRERFGLSPRSDRIEGRVPFEFRAWPMYRKAMNPRQGPEW
ncbi:GlxA family transcriptional regulator [Paracoccus seriniphilus]|uniref:AraC family transcriptional regulator, carnitine catabolism transcriptional activator n=1 Tax=Paracoccus seriniphilus TaxID=184748 RepID=A0A239PNM9_9RHOB|nr:GlxA family transcriptional regulator [Paracoccus seriniphilus]WCR14690.1 GlxA family transcriptional regulator [Paracoccus seriniphilus]SNT71914.1 AraC family transcriptional regulator, carnitine catabolism transcriptional activator [Paracoccus seriniphilus]